MWKRTAGPVDHLPSPSDAVRPTSVAIDGAQNSLAVWSRELPGGVLTESAEMAGAGPVLGPVHIAARVRVGRRAIFSVEPAPWASPLAGPPVWRFGDGKSASGRRVRHVYRRRGRYTVSVRQRDTAGGTSTASVRITVTRASGRS